jgi:multiple sugar transport system permease protein
LFSNSDFFVWLKNSLIVTAFTVLINVFISAMAGYAFAKLSFPGRRALFVAIIATLMVPHFALFIPLFIMIVNVGLMNTYAALILPQAASPVGIFLLKQYSETIPDDLLDAAQIDGCRQFRIFTMVILPLVTPALAAAAIFAFLGSWNSFFWPLISTTQSSMRTLTVGLATLQGQWSGNWSVVMACATMTFLPALIIYLSLQRYFVAGIALSGVKG